MILEMEVEMIDGTGIGAAKAGVSLVLADVQSPRCLVPFELYVRNEIEFAEKHGVKPQDLVGKRVLVSVREMAGSQRGATIKLEGSMAPKGVAKKTVSAA